MFNITNKKVHSIVNPVKIYWGVQKLSDSWNEIPELLEDCQSLLIGSSNAVAEASKALTHLHVVKAHPTENWDLHQALLEGKSCACTYQTFRSMSYEVSKLISKLGVNCCIVDGLGLSLDAEEELEEVPSCCSVASLNRYLSPGSKQVLEAIGALEVDRASGLASWNIDEVLAPIGAGILEDVYTWSMNGSLHWYPTDTEPSKFVLTALPVRLLHLFKSVSILSLDFNGPEIEKRLDSLRVPYKYDNRVMVS